MNPEAIDMYKPWMLILGLFAIIFTPSVSLSATDFRYTREARPQTLTIGDVVEVRVRVTHPQNTQVTPDRLSLSDVFSLRGTQHTTTVSGNSVIETWTYHITVFETGKHQIPESRLRQRLAEGYTVIHTLPPIMLNVVSILPVTASTVGTLKPLMAISLILWPWLLGVGCLALLAWVLWLRYRKKQIKAMTPIPTLSPEEDAMSAIDALTISGVIERGDYDMACSRITDILKRFLSRHYQQKMQEMTSTEVIGTLRGMGLDPWIHTDIDSLFAQADYVKFAHADSSAQACYRLIDTLKKSIAAIANSAEKTPPEGAPHP